ncbi:hypothetical protein MMC07_004745 [Pseudocyphellaria aurata]|nr:hypothetical protein [Pseudocyphellaria aurata]
MQWITGLGALKSAWQIQTKHFGHTHASQYSNLIFDNRGIGGSDKPLRRYSTSEMARDVVELVDHLGWTAPRQLHVVSVSMGGMIAQELALLIPERIASLILMSTAARLVNTVGFMENLRSRINLLIPSSIDTQLASIKPRLLAPDWLSAPDPDGTFPTNGDRFAAIELHKRLLPAETGFSRRGFVLQAIAAGWHSKSDQELARIGREVGKGRILVLHGDRDGMIPANPHVENLVWGLGGDEEGEVRSVVMKGIGHILIIEKTDEIHRLITDMVHGNLQT